jgi:hypothetical protein
MALFGNNCASTGCHKASTILHFHAECKMMPVSECLSMLCTQFLANCLRPTHPSNSIVFILPGPRTNDKGRPLKETLSSRFFPAVEPHQRGGIVPNGLYGKIKEEIHTVSVQDFLIFVPPNKILGVKPPEIDPAKQSVPQVYRTTMAQLHDDKCSGLRNYQHYIKATDDDICPNCQSAPHTALHLFSCTTVPTSLTFWHHPRTLRHFLRLIHHLMTSPPCSRCVHDLPHNHLLEPNGSVRCVSSCSY